MRARLRDGRAWPAESRRDPSTGPNYRPERYQCRPRRATPWRQFRRPQARSALGDGKCGPYANRPEYGSPQDCYSSQNTPLIFYALDGEVYRASAIVAYAKKPKGDEKIKVPLATALPARQPMPRQ